MSHTRALKERSPDSFLAGIDLPYDTVPYQRWLELQQNPDMQWGAARTTC
jgi:hypothetical protein